MFKNKHFSFTELMILFFVLVVIPFVLYFPSLYYEFLPVLDDHWLIIDNEGIKHLSLQGIKFIFFDDKRDLHYMPVTYVSYSIDYFLFGLNPFMIRLHNLLLHILSGILFFIFINLLIKRKNIALLAAFIFLIHPINIESIVWASDRKQSLFFTYMLASLICYKLYLENGEAKKKYGLYVLSIVLWAISVMSKATSITLPFVFILLHLDKDRFAIKIKKISGHIMPMVPLIILFWYLNKVANDRNFLNRDFTYSNFDHLIFAGYSYCYYWIKSLFPFPLAVFYPAPSEHFAVPARYYLMFAGSIFIVGLIIYHFFKKQYALFFALGFYTINIFPLLDLMYYPLGDIPMLVANRYFYHSCLGIILYWILITDAAVKNVKVKSAIAFTYILLLFVLFRVHLPVWKNEIKVFENDVKYYPNEDLLYKLALLYEEKGDTQRALATVDKADKLGTDIWINNIWTYYYQRSKLYIKAAKYDKALKDINTALQKQKFKTPHYDSILEIDKKKIETLIINDSIRKRP